MIYSISDTEYDPSGNSDFSFQVSPGILNLLFLQEFFIFLQVQYMLKFDKATSLSFLFTSILSESLNNGL